MLAAPSMLSKRLKALTTATIHTQVTPRSTSAPACRCQPSPEAHTTQARASSTSTRHRGETVRRSSIVPTTQSSANAAHQRHRLAPVAGGHEHGDAQSHPSPPLRRDRGWGARGPCSPPACRRTADDRRGESRRASPRRPRLQRRRGRSAGAQRGSKKLPHPHRFASTASRSTAAMAPVAVERW